MFIKALPIMPNFTYELLVSHDFFYSSKYLEYQIFHFKQKWVYLTIQRNRKLAKISFVKYESLIDCAGDIPRHIYLWRILDKMKFLIGNSTKSYITHIYTYRTLMITNMYCKQ